MMAHQPETVTPSSSSNSRGLVEHYEHAPSKPSDHGSTELLGLVPSSEGSVHTQECNPKPFYAWVDSLWLFEAVAWVISAAAMASIALVLWVYENRPLPDWPFDDFTINAFVSALSMVSKTTLMVPLTSSIGQLKWLWVKRERPLADLQIFDEASRGPLGALKLLYRTKGVHLVSLGAIITVCALAIDTFIQQSVKLENIFNVALAQPYADGSSCGDYSTIRFPPEMKSAMLQGIHQRPDASDVFQVKYWCPDKECLPRKYSTLAVCNKCEPIDDIQRLHQISRSIGKDFTEYQTYKSDGDGTLRGGIAPSENSTLPWDPLARLIRVAFYRWGNSSPLNATECVKSYSGSVEDGVFKETELGTLDTRANRGEHALCFDAKDDQHLSLSCSTSCITKPAYLSMRWFMYNRILGWKIPDNNLSDPDDTDVVTNRDELERILDYGDIPNSMKIIASSATKAVRQAPAQHNGVATKALQPPGTYIKVRWGWLTLPVALQAMTLVFLVITFSRSRLQKMENWKSSSLAVFRSGVLGQGDFGMTETGRQYEIDGIADQVKICSRYAGTSYTVEHSCSD